MRKYNWKRSIPDHRDHLRTDNPALNIPTSIDLRAKCPPIFDQGQMGSCTGNALAGAMGYHYPELTASRLFIYYNERVMEGDPQNDAGANLRDGIKTLQRFGVCQEEEWPYVPSNLSLDPTSGCYRDAAQYRISEYSSLRSLLQVKASLAANYPVAFGFTVYSSFESNAVATTGMMPMPKVGEKCMGGHAVLAVGYTADNHLIVRNSWGADWGLKGYFYMPVAMLSEGLATDFWEIQK